MQALFLLAILGQLYPSLYSANIEAPAKQLVRFGAWQMASLKKRGSTFYIQYYQGTQQRRISTAIDSLQISKEKLRQFESSQMRGDVE